MALSPDISARALCSQPGIVGLVDEAYARQGGEAQRTMEKQVCPRCPISAECLTEAIDNHEYGPWGGTNAHRRRNDPHLARPTTGATP